MSVVKDAKLVYVAPIPKERSGIGRDVPAHVIVEWIGDAQGRKHTIQLQISDEEVARIATMPNVQPATHLVAIPLSNSSEE